MWIYSKTMQRPVRVSGKDQNLAMNIITQYGGADGEAGAAMRYMTQRFAMPLKEGKGILTDIATEELGHIEMVGEMFSQLTAGASKDEMLAAGLDGYFIDHGCNPFYINTSGQTFDTYAIGSKGDSVVDLTEDLAAEQKARITYENLIKMCDDPLLMDTLRYLREREVVHYQRFGETLRLVQEYYGSKKVF